VDDHEHVLGHVLDGRGTDPEPCDDSPYIINVCVVDLVERQPRRARSGRWARDERGLSGRSGVHLHRG